MPGEFVVYLIVALVLVGAALAVWVLDRRRNREVGQDEERLEPDPAQANDDPHRPR